MMNTKFSQRIESSFSVEATLDLKLDDEDVKVIYQGEFSKENPNKSRASAWINGDGMYRTYGISAESESDQFVGAYGRKSGEFLQVFAQSGFGKQVEENADDDDDHPESGSQLEQADDVVTGAGNGEEEEKEEGDDEKLPVHGEEADDDSGTIRQSDFEQKEVDNVISARKEEQEVKEDVGEQPVQEEAKDADATITVTGEEEEAGHQVQQNPRVEEYLVTRIEPAKTQIKSFKPIRTFNPYDVLAKKVKDVDDDDVDEEEEEEEDDDQPTA